MLQNKRILFFIILFLAVGLRLFNLDKGYNSDEGWLLNTAQLNPKNLIQFLAEGRGGVYPPFSPFALHFWIKLNNAEPWIRGYFVIFGIALCLLVYHLGKLYLNEQFGLVAFFLSAISPLLIWTSHFIRGYIDAAFWAILSVYFMMRILKGMNFWRNSVCYIIASAFALYSSYLNLFILISQNIFILALNFRKLKFLRRWLILQIIICLIFIPCTFLILKQLKLATAIDLKWSERGFQLFGINIGYHARSIIAMLGMDPGFLFIYPLTQKFNKFILASIAGVSFLFIGWLLIVAFKNLRRIFEDKQLIYFFPAISILALLLYDLLIEVKNFPLQPEYFVVQHVLFIFVISSLVFTPGKKNKFNILILAFISFIFIFRYQDAIKPEFDTKKAYSYLEDNTRTTDCLLMVRNNNWYIDSKTFNIIIMNDYMLRESYADYYKPFNERTEMMLSFIKDKYKDVWFYRQYGNDELLGANKLIMSWMKENGYSIETIQKFRRIDIVHYKRSDWK